MSRDSCRTYIHLHSPHHADLFEEFTAPAAQSSNSPTSTAQPSDAASTTLTSTTTHASSMHIPHEDILIPQHLLPPNPEDEDDVVPDQHAAFGITKAMANREGRERAWRDFESLKGLVKGDDLKDAQSKSGPSTLSKMR